MFKTGKSELLPLAKNKLDEVAVALQEIASDKEIVIEGHTDSRGTDQMNQELSQARAESVRSYLVERGVKQDKLKAVGKGESEPIAENDSPEGRANNRRVEMIIKKGN